MVLTGNGTGRGMVLAGEWYWQGNGTDRGMVLTGNGTRREIVLTGEWY